MFAILTVLVVVSLSIFVTKVATIALAHTGLSRESARFQARSAFTGVGFTTSEAEQIVNHPVRRRIVMALMLLGNAGIITILASLILGFVNQTAEGPGWLPKIALLVGGMAGLWALARSPWIDRLMNRLIRNALRRWTALDVADYAALLHLRADFAVGELRVEEGDWMAGSTLAELKLRDEGVNVLGVERADGSYVGTPRGVTELGAGDVLIVYGRSESIVQLDERPNDWLAEREHEKAVEDHRREVAAEADTDRYRGEANQEPEVSEQPTSS